MSDWNEQGKRGLVTQSFIISWNCFSHRMSGRHSYKKKETKYVNYNQPGIHFEFNRFSQLRLHVAANFTEYLKPCTVRPTVISTFASRCVSNFNSIAFIFVDGNIIQLVVDQHFPTEFMIVDVTSRVRHSPLEEVWVFNRFERELWLGFFVKQIVHAVDVKAQLKLRKFGRESAGRVFSYQK